MLEWCENETLYFMGTGQKGNECGRLQCSWATNQKGNTSKRPTGKKATYFLFVVIFPIRPTPKRPIPKTAHTLNMMAVYKYMIKRLWKKLVTIKHKTSLKEICDNYLKQVWLDMFSVGGVIYFSVYILQINALILIYLFSNWYTNTNIDVIKVIRLDIYFLTIAMLSFSEQSTQIFYFCTR